MSSKHFRHTLGRGQIALQTAMRDEARARLAALYERFSQGFETKRLREARSLRLEHHRYYRASRLSFQIERSVDGV